jgi:hypothetical protein
MGLPEQNILKHLTEDTALVNVSADKLGQLTEQYPYYGAVGFLLAKKLFVEDDANKEKALYQAALHFSNELWLNFNLISGLPDNAEPEVATRQLTKVLPDEKTDTADSDEPFYDEEAETVVETNDDPVLSEKLNTLLQQQAAEYEKPVEVTEEIPIEIVPPHRIDYFESQGIKLEEDKSTDKLGKQLKKFTDWLKQMKSINPNPSVLNTDVGGEKEVQHIAEHSNESEEIITETMAEVLEKQGKPEHAIEIYEKLSFNNPSKSAYFAAKIEKLKVR